MALTPRRVVAVLTFLASLAFAASPLFVDGFGGYDPQDFPVPQVDPPVQPAGYAFGIWGLIYAWLILGTGWGLWRRADGAQWHDMRVPLLVSLALGSFWLAVALASPVWATVLIWAMLLAALAALFVAPAGDRAWAAWPVGLYAGWLSAACCVSLGLLAGGYGWLDARTAGLIFVALAAVLGTGVQAILSRTPTYGLAVIWALVAVIVANWTATPVVAYVALAGAAIVALATLRALRNL